MLSARVRARCCGSSRHLARGRSRARVLDQEASVRRVSSRSSPGAITWWRATQRRSPHSPRQRATTTCSCTRAGASCSAAKHCRAGSTARSSSASASWRIHCPRVSPGRSRRAGAARRVAAALPRFLETKGWLDGDRAFLARQFDALHGARRRLPSTRAAAALVRDAQHADPPRARAARAFGAIPFLNGGLFGKTALERRHSRARFSDESLGRFFGEVLGALRFTAREEHERWSEAAIDPEMLGRAFESLMAARERRTSGAFYTPQVLVAHVADAALSSRLARADYPTAFVDAALARRHAVGRRCCAVCGRARVADRARSRLRIGSVPRPPARADRDLLGWRATRGRSPRSAATCSHASSTEWT